MIFTNLSLAESVSFKSFKIKDLTRLQKKFKGDSDKLNSYRTIKSGNQKNLLDDNALYRRIYESLNSHYVSICQRQVDEILGNGFQIGKYNTPGFFWRQSFGEFSIFVTRNIAQGLGGEDRWIVTDEFNIIIEAEKMIGELADDGIIEISQEQMAAFAGVKFKRVYRYEHFADSYEAGLISDYGKLFMSFLTFNSDAIFNMSHNEFIQREDYLSLDIGGIVNYPVYTNGALSIYASAGALGKFERITTSDVHYTSDVAQKLIVSYENKKSTDIGIALQLKIDFLNLLRFTLFSYDFSYQHTVTERKYLMFEDDQVEVLKNSEVMLKKVREILAGKSSDEGLEEYILFKKKIVSERKKTGYEILLTKGQKSEDTKQTDVIEDNMEETFFTHSYEKIKNQYSLLGKIVPEIIHSLFMMDVNGRAIASDRKAVNIDYQSKRDIIKNKEILAINPNEEKLSITMQRDSYYKKTDGLTGKKNKSKIVKTLMTLTPADKEIADFFSNGNLKGPMKVNVVMQMGKKAVDHFHSLSINEFNNGISRLCHNYSSDDGSIESCMNNLNKVYMEYWDSFMNENITNDVKVYCQKKASKFRLFTSKKQRLKKCVTERFDKIGVKRSKIGIPLWKFKDVLIETNRYLSQLDDIYALFGRDNVFIHGSMVATTSKDLPFVNYFNQGIFEGTSVVDKYLSDITGLLPEN